MRRPATCSRRSARRTGRCVRARRSRRAPAVDGVSSQDLSPRARRTARRRSTRAVRRRILLRVRHGRLCERARRRVCGSGAGGEIAGGLRRSRSERGSDGSSARDGVLLPAGGEQCSGAARKGCRRRTRSRRCLARACCPMGARGRWSRRRISMVPRSKRSAAKSAREHPGRRGRRRADVGGERPGGQRTARHRSFEPTQLLSSARRRRVGARRAWKRRTIRVAVC